MEDLDLVLELELEHLAEDCQLHLQKLGDLDQLLVVVPGPGQAELDQLLVVVVPGPGQVELDQLLEVPDQAELELEVIVTVLVELDQK